MNKILSTTLIVLAVLALAAGIFFAGTIYARPAVFGPGAVMYGRMNNYNFGPGMMNGRMGYGTGPGMMRNFGWNRGAAADLAPLTIEQARQSAEKYLQTVNLPGLEIGEIMIFDNNAYVTVLEKETGLGAFELLVDPATQLAYPEHGPNMMWNLKYSGLNHAGMMGWTNQNQNPGNVGADMSVSPAEAVELAQKYLDAGGTGAVASSDATQFYGYYTLDFEQDGKAAGMLSVNGATGQIFLHTWHGAFIEETE